MTSTVLRKVLWNLIYHFGLFTSPCFNEWINEPQIQLREKKMHKVGMIFKRFIQYNFYFFIHKTSILMTLQIKCFNVLIVIIYFSSLICIYIYQMYQVHSWYIYGLQGRGAWKIGLGKEVIVNKWLKSH